LDNPERLTIDWEVTTMAAIGRILDRVGDPPGTPQHRDGPDESPASTPRQRLPATQLRWPGASGD